MDDFSVNRRNYLIISAAAGAATSVARPAAAATGDGDDNGTTEPARTLTITVVDEDGDPVENATVSVVTADGGTDVESGEPDSDGDGDDDVVAGYPTIQQFALRDTSPPNPHVSLAVEWSVAHENAALSSVYVEARSQHGQTVGTATTDVSGSMASGTDLFTIDHATGDTFIVSIFVTDTADNTTTEYDRLDTFWRSSMQSD